MKVEGRTATFKDGTTKDVDAIILCAPATSTISLSLQTTNLRLRTANRLASADLYNDVSYIHEPDLFQSRRDQWYTFNMFDNQAWWTRDSILGKIPIRDKAVMAACVNTSEDAEDALEDDNAYIRIQGRTPRN